MPDNFYPQKTLITDENGQPISWVWLGFQIGIGLGLASMIFAAAGAFIAFIYANYQVQLVTNNFRQATAPLHAASPSQFQPPPIIAPAQQSIRDLPPPPRPTAPPLAPTTIAPEESTKTCLYQAHGVYDENYLACIRAQQQPNH